MARLAVVVFLFLHVVLGYGQNLTLSDPEALALARKSSAILTGGTAIIDAILSASAISIAGSGYLTGTAQLEAQGTTESRVRLLLDSGRTKTDVRSEASGVPESSKQENGGAAAVVAQQNCWTDAAWFFPALSSLGSPDSSRVLTYVGQEKRGDLTVEHLRSYRLWGPPRYQGLFQRLSTMDFYLEATSLLPVSIAFETYPDKEMNSGSQVEVRFADFRKVNGANVPFRIQRLVNGSLTLDLEVTNVAIDSGVPATDFEVAAAEVQQ